MEKTIRKFEIYATIARLGILATLGLLVLLIAIGIIAPTNGADTEIGIL